MRAVDDKDFEDNVNRVSSTQVLYYADTQDKVWEWIEQELKAAQAQAAALVPQEVRDFCEIVDTGDMLLDYFESGDYTAADIKPFYAELADDIHFLNRDELEDFFVRHMDEAESLNLYHFPSGELVDYNVTFEAKVTMHE